MGWIYMQTVLSSSCTLNSRKQITLDCWEKGTFCYKTDRIYPSTSNVRTSVEGEESCDQSWSYKHAVVQTTESQTSTTVEENSKRFAAEPRKFQVGPEDVGGLEISFLTCQLERWSWNIIQDPLNLVWVKFCEARQGTTQAVTSTELAKKAEKSQLLGDVF
ncbi:hypothetical protein Bbelb_203940 [Branchiostoma belcheri]|nr:hypothetical protein Bbelb_203940 [Branchiostoma belcheri]